MKFNKTSFVLILVAALMSFSFTNVFISDTPNGREATDLDVHLVAEVSDHTVNLEERITINYKLYVSYDVGISNWEILEQPQHEGFDISNVDVKKMIVEKGTFKGEPYRFVVLQKTILQAKEKGKFTTTPFKVKITAEIPSKEKDNKGMRLMTSVNKVIETDVLTISVE